MSSVPPSPMELLIEIQHFLLGTNWAKFPSGHCWDYYHVVLSFNSNHCNSYEDRAPADFIYGWAISNWIAVTWQEWGGTEIVTPALSVSRHVLLCEHFFFVVRNADPDESEVSNSEAATHRERALSAMQATEAEKNGCQFFRRQLQMHFLVWTLLHCFY